MAITPDKLTQRFSNTFVLSVPMRVTVSWEVVHTEWVPETIVGSGSESAEVRELSRLADVYDGLQGIIALRMEETERRYKPMAAIDNQSFEDVTQIFDHWKFTDNGNGTMTGVHPVCGTFTGAADNTPLGLVTGILAVCLPPPAWAWFDSVVDGQLRTKCVEVTGAEHYAVYAEDGDDFEHLGDVDDYTLNTLDVDPGEYVVRICAVTDTGNVGILSRPQAVIVGGA